MATDSVCFLGSDQGQRFFSSVVRGSREAQELQKALLDEGLEPQPERTQLFSLFSTDSLASIAVSVTPFTSKDFEREGGLSMSQGGHAQAVVVDIRDRTEIVGFTHYAVAGGEVVTSQHGIHELYPDGDRRGHGDEDYIRRLAEETGKVRSAQSLVEVDTRQVRSLASLSYNNLLSDDFSRSVHDEREVLALRAGTNVVAEIGLFVLFRTSGSSCCSCSCSCWGSSSCSSSYVK